MICNSVVMSAVKGFNFNSAVNVPTHKAIQASLDVGEYGRTISRMCVPRAFPIEALPKWEE